MAVGCRVCIESEDEETVWVRWELADPPDAAPAASGRVAYDLETVHFHWLDGAPPREHEGVVRVTIDRAIRGRPRAGVR
jgi:hypothetical protein